MTQGCLHVLVLRCDATQGMVRDVSDSRLTSSTQWSGVYSAAASRLDSTGTASWLTWNFFMNGLI